MKDNIVPLLTNWQLGYVNRAVTCTWTYQWSERKLAEYWLQLTYKITRRN